MPTVGRHAPTGKKHVQSVIFSRQKWTVAKARSWLKEHKYHTDGLDTTNESYRFRQYDPQDGKFRYRNTALSGGVTLVYGIPKGVAMALNYPVEKQADGSLTLKGVEIGEVGKWRPARGPKIFHLTDAIASQLIESTTEVFERLRPAVHEYHEDEGGPTWQWFCDLGKPIRAGSKILADFKGLTEESLARLKTGRLGRLSPDILPKFLDDSTGKTHEWVILGVSFLQGKMPAITTLKPLVTFARDGEQGESLRLLELIEDPEPVALSFARRISREEDEDMDKEREAQLDSKEKALKDEKVALEGRADDLKSQVTAFEEQKQKFHEEQVGQYIIQCETKLTPAEQETHKTIALAMPTEHLPAYFGEILKRPDVENKSTEGAGPTASKKKDGEEEAISFEQRVWDKAYEYQKDHPNEPIQNCLGPALGMLGPEAMDEYKDWRKKSFKTVGANEVPAFKSVQDKDKAAS